MALPGLLGLVSLIVSPWTGVVLVLVARTGIAYPLLPWENWLRVSSYPRHNHEAGALITLPAAGKELIMNGNIMAVLPFAAVFGFAGYRVGTGRGRPVLGVVLGFALGLIGLGIFMLIPRTAQAQARHDRERAERQQPEQLTENQDTVR